MSEGYGNIFYNEQFIELFIADRVGEKWNKETQGGDAFDSEGNPTEYKPGHWFNSAKFLDIEYQTYGWVFSKPRENEAHFHWKHDDDTKCITVCYDTTTNRFLGIT